MLFVEKEQLVKTVKELLVYQMKCNEEWILARNLTSL